MRRKEEIRHEIKENAQNTGREANALGAMRIFAALSMVDEEMLERSEEQTKVVPFRKYAKVMAACVCFVVLGVAVWTGNRSFSTKESAADCAAPEVSTVMEGAGAAAWESTGANMEAAVEEAETENEMAGVTEDTAAEMEGVQEPPAASENKAQEEVPRCDGDSIDSTAEALDEEGLRATELLGDYIPTKLPSGYLFESGYRYNGEEVPKSVHLLWTKDRDDIRISVREYITEEEIDGRLVDVSKPETYDSHLYEIPYCDTVPEEYYEVFNYPIFKEADLSRDVVMARMKRVTDQGDTSTPRGNFAVLYDNGVVVEFNGRGDAESIWEMFQSIERD